MKASTEAGWGDVLLARDVMRLAREAGLRSWNTPPSLAAASRNGTGPAGRFRLGNQAAYRVADFERWVHEERQRQAAQEKARKDRAAYARSRRAASVAAKRKAVADEAAVAEIERLRRIIEAAGINIPPTG